MARALLFESHLPTHFWSYVIKHTVFLVDRVPSPVIQNQTPFELLFAQPPDFSDLRIFGCLYYASTYATHCKKFDPRSKCGIFLGFQSGTKGYVIFLQTHDIFISRHGLFHEGSFSFSHTHKPPSLPFGLLTPSHRAHTDTFSHLPST